VIAQNYSRMRAAIQEYGCYFLSLTWFGWKYGQLELSAELINEELYETFVKRGWMRETCFILRPDEILNYLRVPVTGVVKRPASYVVRDSELAVGQWKASGMVSHFVAMDNDRCVAYDPWQSREGGSRAVREGQLISYRIFQRG